MLRFYRILWIGINLQEFEGSRVYTKVHVNHFETRLYRVHALVHKCALYGYDQKNGSLTRLKNNNNKTETLTVSALKGIILAGM